MDRQNLASPNLTYKPVTKRSRMFQFNSTELTIITQASKDGQIKAQDLYIFLTVEIFDVITEETNRHAGQCINKVTVTRTSKMKQWYPTTRKEIRKTLRIIMCTWLMWKPEVSLYWSKKENYDYLIVYKHMTRDRLQILMRFLQHG